MLKKDLALLLVFAISFPFSIFADETVNGEENDEIIVPEREKRVSPPKQGGDAVFVQPDTLASDSLRSVKVDIDTLATDSITAGALSALADTVDTADRLPTEFELRRNFNPDPIRAVWLSALCPGLGQIYNRRYWKLPIVIGGYAGLVYATSWNNRMLTDYTQAYRDITDSDPNTKSYMDLYPPTTREEDIDMEWLERSLRSKKNFYRRNRDLCIIGMVGLYLVCMVDAYVDASLSHFDISPNLSMDVAPAVIGSADRLSNSIGVQCALTF